MKNFRKLVSFVFVMISAFVLGFTTINAENIPDTITVTANTQTADGWWIHPNLSLVKYSKADGNYVFCLDSGKDVDLGVPLKYSSSLYSDKVEAVNRIVNKAYNLGLGSSNQWGISDKNFYGITQIAVWKAVHGEGEGGYTSTYKAWIQNNGFGEVLNTIYAAVNEPVSTPSVSFDGSSTLVESGNYMVSNDIKVNTNVSATLTLSVKGGEVFANGSWTTDSVTVKNGDVIKVRVSRPSTGSGSVSATISINSSEFAYGFNTYFYLTATAGKQNIGAAVTNNTTVSTKMDLSGNYKNEEKKEKKLSVSKTDATGQKELPGAKLTLKDNKGNIVESWVSIEEEHRVSGLEIGAIYEIIEDYAPKGYAPIQNSIKFVLNEDGSVTTCNVKKSNDGKDICEAMSTEDILKIKNEVTKLDVSKTDATGQKELPGAKLTIKDSNGNEIDSWVSTEKEHRVSGLEIGAIYEIIEDYAPEGYEPLKNSIKFVLNADGSVTTCNIKKSDDGKDVCEAMSTEDILKIKNEVKKDDNGNVVISKKDFTNGEELPGAQLKILDENGKVVAEWVSTDKPYEISLPEGKYVLIETIPASDYNPEMIINGDRTSRYEFEIVKGKTTKIDVYNQIIGVPKTGVSVSGLYAIGGFVMLAGAATIVFAKKKEMI